MTRKSKEQPVDNSIIEELNKDFFDELIRDTNFTYASTGSLMTSRMRVPTPLIVLNCIYGGGLPMAVISEVSGPPSSGKTTFLYQTGGLYQKKYPKGVLTVFDQEASSDDNRLKVLGVDTDSMLRLPATSIEDTFKEMFKMLEKISVLKERIDDISLFMIYDSIDAGGTNKQHKAIESGQSAFGAGSMMEQPRIIKQNLKNVFTYMEKFPLFLGLINQVFAQPGQFVTRVSSGGGFGICPAK